MIQVNQVCTDPVQIARTVWPVRIIPYEDPWCKIIVWIRLWLFSYFILFSQRPCESVLKALGFKNYALCFELYFYFGKLSIHPLLNFTVAVQLKGSPKNMVPSWNFQQYLGSSYYNRLNSEKFQKVSLLSLNYFYDNQNDNKGEFLDFYELTLYMILKIFPENSHYRNGHFQENLKNHI